MPTTIFYLLGIDESFNTFNPQGSPTATYALTLEAAKEAASRMLTGRTEQEIQWQSYQASRPVWYCLCEFFHELSGTSKHGIAIFEATLAGEE